MNANPDFASAKFPLADAHYAVHSLEPQPYVVDYSLTIIPGDNVLPYAKAHYAFVVARGVGNRVALLDRTGRIMIANYPTKKPICYPQPGDAVKINGRIGIINGHIGHPADHYRVGVGGTTFYGLPRQNAPSPFIVLTSDNVEWFEISTSDLVATDKTVEVDTWHWSDCPRYEGGEMAKVTMRVWTWNIPNPQ